MTTRNKRNRTLNHPKISTNSLFCFSRYLVIIRCQRYLLFNRARPSILRELMKLLAQSRSLSFKAKRKGDMKLGNEAHRPHNFRLFEPKCFQ